MSLFHTGTAFRQIFYNSRVPLALASARDDDFPLIAVNGEFEELTGYSSAEAIGQNCRFLARKSAGGDQQARLRSVLKRKESGSQTVTNFRKSGGEFLNFVTLFPLFGLNGMVEYFVGSQIDVTRATTNAQQTLHLGADAPVSAKLVQDSLESSLRSATVYTKSVQLLLQMTINEAFERHAVRGTAGKAADDDGED